MATVFTSPEGCSGGGSSASLSCRTAGTAAWHNNLLHSLTWGSTRIFPCFLWYRKMKNTTVWDKHVPKVKMGLKCTDFLFKQIKLSWSNSVNSPVSRISFWKIYQIKVCGSDTNRCNNLFKQLITNNLTNTIKTLKPILFYCTHYLYFI